MLALKKNPQKTQQQVNVVGKCSQRKIIFLQDSHNKDVSDSRSAGETSQKVHCVAEE